MKILDFKRAGSVDEACRMLAELGSEGLPLAGGTSLHFMKGSEGKVAVDISRTGIAGVSQADGRYSVGAVTTVAELMETGDGDFPLAVVARHCSTNQIRHMCTIGGNVARVFPWADFPVALLALDGSFHIVGPGGARRTMGSVEFFDGQPARHFSPGEILETVSFDRGRPGTGFGYRKEVRTAAGFSFVTAAAVIELDDGGAIASARVALGAAVGLPRRLPDVEQALTGSVAEYRKVEEVVSGVVADMNLRCNEGQGIDYTRRLVAVAVADAVVEAVEAAGKGASRD